MLKRSFEFKQSDIEGAALSGYAFKYSEIAEGWYGKERFSSDLKVNFNERCFLFRDHNPERLLARLGKNLEMKQDDIGLFFQVNELPETELARETRELCKKGIITGASVGFLSISERIEKEIRVFEEIEVFEVSLVPRPYYESSEVTARDNKEPEFKPLPPEIVC